MWFRAFGRTARIYVNCSSFFHHSYLLDTEDDKAFSFEGFVFIRLWLLTFQYGALTPKMFILPLRMLYVSCCIPCPEEREERMGAWKTNNAKNVPEL